MPPRTLTVVIPAFNEEGNVGAAIDSVSAVVTPLVDDYEIIVVDDGSCDRTRAVAEDKAGANPKVSVSANDRNRGFGYSFARGVHLARMEYVTVFPGDNDMAASSLASLIREIGHADVITSHTVSNNKRSLFRRILSRSFVAMMNTLFGLHMKYYNGALVCRTALLRSIPIKSTGLAALAECLVRLIKSGHSYISVCFEHTGRKTEKSKALTFKSIRAVLKTVMILINDIYFSPPKKT